MSLHFAECESLVIASGATASRWVDTQNEVADADAISIQAPGTLAEAITIQVADDIATPAAFQVLTVAVAGPTVATARVYTKEYNPANFKFWRLLAGAGVAADRTFILRKRYNAY